MTPSKSGWEETHTFSFGILHHIVTKALGGKLGISKLKFPGLKLDWLEKEVDEFMLFKWQLSANALKARFVYEFWSLYSRKCISVSPHNISQAHPSLWENSSQECFLDTDLSAPYNRWGTAGLEFSSRTFLNCLSFLVFFTHYIFSSIRGYPGKQTVGHSVVRFCCFALL